MTDADISTVVSERHQAVANTWAELFCKDEPGYKQLFNDHYLERTVVHRFWASAGEVNGQKIAVCRLGDGLMLAFHKGQIIKLKITREKVEGLTIPASSLGPTKKMGRFLKSIHMKLQGERSPGEPLFDALTSFSLQASHAVNQVLTGDIPKKLGIYPSPKSRYAGYYSVRYKRYITNYGNALKRFLAEVDQSILFSIRSVRCPSIALYNWLAEGTTERRLQALRAYPVLVPMEVLLVATGQTRKHELTSLVEGGESIAPLLAQLHGTRTSVIKKLGRLSPYQIGSSLSFLKYDYSRFHFKSTIAAFELGSKRPKTKKGWKACLSAMVKTDLTESNLAGMPAWESDDWETLIPRIRNLNDLGKYKDILVKGSLRKALSFSDEWHAKRNEVQAALLATGEYKAYSWPGMLSGNAHHDETGLTFVEITDNISLAYEGGEMGHCVGGYSWRCFDGTSRIISIRNQHFSVATLEFRLETSKSGRKSYRCVQAQGPGNTSLAGKPASKALKWFTKNLRKFVSTYELGAVPRSHRPEGNSDLSKRVMDEMRGWIEIRMKNLGVKEEMNVPQHTIHHQNDDRDDDF